MHPAEDSPLVALARIILGAHQGETDPGREERCIHGTPRPFPAGSTGQHGHGLLQYVSDEARPRAVT
jgi:hypothetical protein